MAAYEITATIMVYGVRSERDAINELQIMLNDYEDNNSWSGKEIAIDIVPIKKVED